MYDEDGIHYTWNRHVYHSNINDPISACKREEDSCCFAKEGTKLLHSGKSNLLITGKILNKGDSFVILFHIIFLKLYETCIYECVTAKV
jgi:hypothetical protein